MIDHDQKISGVEAPMNPVQQQAGPSEGRRRLVKGALAAPAVMTLMNGRLASAASVACDLKLDGTQAQEGWIAPNGNRLFTYESQGDGDPHSDLAGQLVYYDAYDKELQVYTGGAVSPSCWASLEGTEI